MLEGAQVGSYRVVRRIGEGGMGEVWLAEHVTLGRRAAIKVLHAQFSMRPEIVKRFFNEARAASSISDPGIVQIFDFGQEKDGSAYIVMEALDGEPLDKRLARFGALEVADAIRIVRQAATTLGAAHASGIIHRDLKPENLFLVRDPEVVGGERTKILDFGIAKLSDDVGGVKTKTDMIMGTPTYMSPEQCKGAGFVDARSDIYSLGCVLFTLVVGHPPFRANGAGELIVMHLIEAPPVPSQLRPGLPAEIDELIARCLDKEPANRFANGAELATALGALASRGPHATPIPGYTPAPQLPAVPVSTTLSGAAGATGAEIQALKRSSRGNGRVYVAVAGAVAAIAAVVVVVTSRPDKAPATAAAGSEPAVPADAAVDATALVATAATATPPDAAPDPRSLATPGIKDVLARFDVWSRDHAGAPCPTAPALGAPVDPWGGAFLITCTNQPGDHTIGVMSAGPDRVPANDDDIVSWQLGPEVTTAVRGERWRVSSRTTASTAPKQRARTVTPPAPQPGPVQPATGTTRPKVQLDENGLPISR